MCNFVSLNFLPSEGIGFVPAENEDLTVMEDKPTSVSSPKGRGCFFDARRDTFACRGELSGIGGNGLVIGIFSGYAIAVLRVAIETRYRELQAVCGHNGCRSVVSPFTTGCKRNTY